MHRDLTDGFPNIENDRLAGFCVSPEAMQATEVTENVLYCPKDPNYQKDVEPTSNKKQYQLNYKTFPKSNRPPFKCGKQACKLFDLNAKTIVVVFK